MLIDVTSLLGTGNSRLGIIPPKSGNFTLKGSPDNGLTFVKQLKAFDNNVSIKVEQNYKLSASIMNIFYLQRDAPTTIDVTYSLLIFHRIEDAYAGIGHAGCHFLFGQEEKRVGDIDRGRCPRRHLQFGEI